LSLRAYGGGYRVVLFPDVTVIHSRTQTGRSGERNSFLVARNLLLCWLLNLPFRLCVWRRTRSVCGLVFIAVKGRQRFTATVKGILESGRVFWKHRKDRKALPAGRLRGYFSLPYASFGYGEGIR